MIRMPLHCPHSLRFGIGFGPLAFAVLPQVILIVQQQFLQACPRNIYKA